MDDVFEFVYHVNHFNPFKSLCLSVASCTVQTVRFSMQLSVYTGQPRALGRGSAYYNQLNNLGYFNFSTTRGYYGHPAM